MSQKLSNRWWNKVKSDAAKRNITVSNDLTLEVLQKIFDAQNGKCYFTGLKLKIHKSGRNPESTLSLDRISSYGHYSINNVCFVHKKINMMKGRLTQSDFIKICKRVAKYND